MNDVIKRVDVPDDIRPAFERRPTLVKAEVWRSIDHLAREISDARAVAEQLVQSARDEASQVRDAAREEGETMGSERFFKAVALLQEDHEKWRERAEPEAVELALKIAERVIGDIAMADPRVVRATAVRAAQAARGRGDVAIRVHPESAAVLQADVTALQAALGVMVRIVEDETLSPPDCVVHTAVGDIDARVATQLMAIRRVLQEGA